MTTQQPTSSRKTRTVTVKVNNSDVTFSDRHATGSDIKATAIVQGVQIEQTFNLFEIKGGRLKPVADNDRVSLHPNQEFTAVAPDDNS